MVRRIVWIVGIALPMVLGSLSLAQDQTTSSGPLLENLRAHVEVLASPEFEGRRGAGARKAAAFIVERFQRFELEPLFDGDYYQAIPGTEGRNLGARLLGSDPDLRDEWIIISAHYDHLGVRGGVVYPGADDNASGVAMLLEVARNFAEAPEPPKRSVMFVSFDLEEQALQGSRHFVQAPPVPLEQIKLFITADMIGRSLGGVCHDHVFVLGAENAPGLRPWIKRASNEQPLIVAEGRPLAVGLVGSDVLVLDRSDYGPFRARRVPYLFFTTGENPSYHTPDDVPETLDYPKLEAISRLIQQVLLLACEAPEIPAWAPTTTDSVEEAEAILQVLEILLEHEEELGIPSFQRGLMRNTITNLSRVLERGSITPAERRGMVRIAQLVLFTVL